MDLQGEGALARTHRAEAEAQRRHAARDATAAFAIRRSGPWRDASPRRPERLQQGLQGLDAVGVGGDLSGR